MAAGRRLLRGDHRLDRGDRSRVGVLARDAARAASLGRVAEAVASLYVTVSVARKDRMMPLNLAAASTILREALAHARAAKFKPLAVVVLDQRGVVIAAASEDGTSLGRFEIARGKASGALAFNLGSRKLGEMAVERPHFFAARGARRGRDHPRRRRRARQGRGRRGPRRGRRIGRHLRQ